MRSTTTHPLASRRRQGGYALPAVLLFLLFAFGVWAIFFRSSGSLVRIEQARVLRESRDLWSAPAMATALRLLQTGQPPSDPYACKLTLTQDGQTHYYRLYYERMTPTRWSVTASVTDVDDIAPDAPATFETLPNAPTGLNVTVVSSTQLDLSWTDHSSNETGFLIERSFDGSTGWTQIGSTATNVTTYSSTGLIFITTYYYRVRATNAAGESGYTTPDSATTANDIPIAPSGLAASPASASQIDLSWSDNSNNETGFLIERSPDGSTAWSQIAIAGPDTTSLPDTGLSSNTTYYYRVRATNALGESAYTSTANATTNDVAPAAPSGLGATVSSSSQIELAWTDNSNNETGFKIERSPNGSTGWSEVATPAANATSYSDTGLSAATAYYYRIRATNAIGDSSYSSNASATTLPNPPSAPSALSATGANSSTVNLTWTDNANNETGFKIERSPDGSTNWNEIATVGANVTSYSDTGLAASTTYWYRVRAYNTGGNSAFSATDSGVTTAIPAPPSGLTVTVISATSLKLDWTDNSNNETGFRIRRSTDGINWITINTTAAGAVTYTNTGLTTGQIYYYRVRALGAAGNSAYCPIANGTPN